MPLLPMTPTTFTPWRASVSNSMPLKPNAPSPSEQDDLAVGVRELGGERVAGAGAQAAERARVQPAARLVGVDDAPGVGDEVAAVADDDRVAVEHLAELVVQRASGAAARGRRAARPARPRASRSRCARRSCTQAVVLDAAGRRPRAARRASPAAPPYSSAATGRGCSRTGSARSSTTISVSSPNACPKPRRKSIGTPMTSATSAPLQRRASRAREEQLVVGRHAAARQAVEEDRDAQLLGQRAAAPARRGPSRGWCRP